MIRGESSNRIGWYVRLFYDTESSSKDIAEFDAHDVGTGAIAQFSSDAILLDISPITSSIDPFNGSYSVANCTVRIADAERHGESGSPQLTLAEILDLSTKGYLNRKASIYKYAATADSTLFTDGVKVFEGLILDYSFDVLSGVYTIELIHIGERYHKELPSAIITQAAYPKAPESSLNKPIPILYGSWFTSNANPYYDYYHNLLNCAPCVCTDAHEGYFAIAHHAIVSWADSDVGIFDDGLQAYGLGLVRDDGTTYPSITVSGPSYATIGATAATSYWKVSGVYLFPSLKGTQSGITTEDVQYITDRRYDTAETLTTDYFVAFSGGLSSSIFWPLQPTSGDIYVFANIANYSGANTTRFRMYNPDTATFYQDGSTFSTDGLKTGNLYNAGATAGARSDGNGNNYGATDNWTIEELGRYEFGLDIGVGVSYDVGTFGIVLSNLSVSQLSLVNRDSRIRKGPPSRFAPNPNDYGISDPLGNVGRDASRRMIPFSQSNLVSEVVYGRNMDGRAIPAAIGGRAGNTLTTGNVMIMSHFIAEDIARQELSIPTGNIDDVSFDAAVEADSYMFCFSVPDFVNSRDLIRDLGHNSLSTYFFTPDGNFTCFQIPLTPSSSNADLDFQDINFRRFYWSSPDWLVNDLLVNYHYDYAKQSFQMQATASDATSQGDSSDGYYRTKKYIIDSPYFRYQPFLSGALKADDFATNFLACWKDTHLMIDFDLHNPLYEGLQDGDIVTFVNVPGLANSWDIASLNPFGLGGGSADDCMSSFTSPRTKYFVIIATTRNPESGTTSYSCMQLHNL